MKYKLLSYKNHTQINIGDYIQDLASCQFLPSLDGFVNIDSLDSYCGDECKVIFNGWFMHSPKHWPPSAKINPLFVAFHLNVSAKDYLLSDESIKYFKRYEPIGCRDTKTRDLLVDSGVKAYFSGCMTLTLGEKYKSNKRGETIYFVDPYFKMEKSLFAILENFFLLCVKFKKILIINRKLFESGKCLVNLLKTVTFYKEYRILVSYYILLNAEYIIQQSYRYSLLADDYVRLKCAEELVIKYSMAKFVVTSRIHCALPCIGLETPVLFIEDSEQKDISSCRFGGLRELFNIVQWKQNHLVIDKKYVINDYLKLTNKTDYIALKNSLIERCRTFMS